MREQDLKNQAAEETKAVVVKLLSEEISKLDSERIKTKKLICSIEAKIKGIKDGTLPREKVDGQFTAEQAKIILELTGRDINEKIEEYNSRVLPLRETKANLGNIVTQQIVRKRKIAFLRLSLRMFKETTMVLSPAVEENKPTCPKINICKVTPNHCACDMHGKYSC